MAHYTRVYEEKEQMVKILVIDDDDLVRGMICNILKKNDFTVLEAENGNVGLEQVKAGDPPALVITDILMPDKEGLETISEIRALNPQIKIIAMSGGGKTQDMTFLNLAKHIGAEKTLQKPFRPTELLATVKEVLGA